MQQSPPDLEARSGTPRPVAVQITNVAGDAATQAVLSDVIKALTKAKREGCSVLELDPTTIDAAHLMWNCMRVNLEAMPSLVVSIAVRGQQSPIEVANLGQGKYGLISGWRRITAIKQLGYRLVLGLRASPCAEGSFLLSGPTLAQEVQDWLWQRADKSR